MDFSYLSRRSVLVTGGTGSFGNAFIARILAQEPRNRPARLIVFSRDEQKQEDMARHFPDECMRYFIGDVRDVDRLEMAMRGVDLVVHAAALKIVPIAEYNPFEVVRTNVIGSQNVITAAIRAGVKKVIALSTDKAVNPINLYGATKLAAEKLFIAANNLSAETTRFSVVRYGNVVGSRGSVLPLFRKLKAAGMPLTVTHADMTRFWILLPQAVEFVLSCIEHSHGREVFIPKMPSIKIMDLAEALSDQEPKIIGIRPGEKIHEVLITEDEARFARFGDDRYVIQTKPLPHAKPFRYSSDLNDRWLSVDDLKKMVEQC